MYKTFDIRLDTEKGIENELFTVNTNDRNTPKIIITVTQDGQPVILDGSTVQLAIQKPDGNTVHTSGTVTSGEVGICEFILTTQSFNVRGTYGAELMINYTADQTAVTGGFNYVVKRAILNDETIESTNEYQLIYQSTIDANEAAVNANTEATYAKSQGDYAKQVANDLIIIRKAPVANFAAIATTYPSPANGWVVQTTDNGRFYRYENGTWNFIEEYNSTTLTAIQNEINQTNRQSQTLTHGVAVLNATANTPVDIQIEGRTLVPLQNNVLEAAKNYVLSAKRTRLKWADASITQGVAKFTGKAEKPVIIRVANYEGKVTGSTLENPHVSKWAHKATMITPIEGGETGTSGTSYSQLSALDNGRLAIGTTANGLMSQTSFSYDLIAEVERQIGRIPRSTVATKIQWLKDNLARLTANWHGYGSSVGGNKATIARYRYGTTNAWESSGANVHTNPTVTKLNYSISTLFAEFMDANGFVHFLAYAEPSDGTTASTINTDYIDLEIELKPEAVLHDPLVPLYEVDSADYAKILVDWNETVVMNRYPKVSGVQHLQNPAVIAEGENLLPPFSEWTKHANATILSPYELELNATAINQWSNISIPVLPNTQYTLKANNPNAQTIKALFYNGPTYLGSAGYLGTGTGGTFTTPANCDRVLVEYINNVATGKFTFSQPMLTLGNTAKPFVPRNPSYLFAQTKLGQIGTSKDSLFKQDGAWVVRKGIEKDVVLDGAQAWVFGSDYAGFKRFVLPIAKDGVNGMYALSKYDGKMIKTGATPSDITTPETSYLYTTNSNPIGIQIPDTDTGFGETYSPAPDEVKAYFNGWKASTVDANGKPLTWVSVVDGSAAPTQTLVYVAANKAPNYTPYKLSYVLSAPRTEVVQVEGDIAANGLTQVEVTSGVIVREKATPAISSTPGYYDLNVFNLPNSYLKNKVSRILKIYKNGADNTAVWTFSSTISNGTHRAFIKSSDFDTTAEYTVTYSVLDREKFTVNALNAVATYANNIRSAVDDLAKQNSDNTTNISINIQSIAELYKRIKALGG